MVDINSYIFVIDSESLEEVESRLYGYAIYDSTIHDRTEDIDPAKLDGTGAYVYVDRNDRSMKIYQDFLGCFEILLYRDGGYFALSNSFFKLIEHLKERKRVMTVNRDYVYVYLADTRGYPHSVNETAVKEIERLRRTAVIDINMTRAECLISHINYHEGSLSIDTAAGVEALDIWFEKWTDVVFDIGQRTQNLSVDLSGGMDTRMTLPLVLMSGISKERFCINTYLGKTHTMVEDFVIAREIAEHFGLGLNDDSKQMLDYDSFSLDDRIAISCYITWMNDKGLYMWHYCPRYRETLYSMSGHGGATVRAFLTNDFSEFKEKKMAKAGKLSHRHKKEYAASIERICRRTENEMREMYRGTFYESNPASKLNLETQCRDHFGQQAVEGLYGNQYILQPLVDPVLHKIRLSTEKCKDLNLLTAVILDRYIPDLLDFRFDSGRKINAETVSVAREINRTFPYKGNKRLPEAFSVTMDTPVSREERNNLENERKKETDECFDYLFNAFSSTTMRERFTQISTDELYRYGWDYAQKTAHYPSMGYSGIIATTLFHDILDMKGENMSPKQRLDAYINSNVGSYNRTFMEKATDTVNRRLKPFIRRGITKIRSRLHG